MKYKRSLIGIALATIMLVSLCAVCGATAVTARTAATSSAPVSASAMTTAPVSAMDTSAVGAAAALPIPAAIPPSGTTPAGVATTGVSTWMPTVTMLTTSDTTVVPFNRHDQWVGGWVYSGAHGVSLPVTLYYNAGQGWVKDLSTTSQSNGWFGWYIWANYPVTLRWMAVCSGSGSYAKSQSGVVAVDYANAVPRYIESNMIAWASPQMTSHGQAITLHGRVDLGWPYGLPGRTVTLQVWDSSHKTWVPVKSLTTGTNGYFSFSLISTAPRIIYVEWYYHGENKLGYTLFASTSNVVLLVWT